MKPAHLLLLLNREMPYGKYKGRVIADLPGHYLGWFAREGFPRGELGELLALMYELDHNALRGLLDPLRMKKPPSPRYSFPRMSHHSCKKQ
ncbi:MAG: DUF3820 family protein [Bdellovibrionales bacterium]|nr:DUF3820 family protein [Massilia sp.]